MEKTVVEWLHNELKNLIRHSELTDMKPSFFDEKETEIIEQAKKMENNRIEESIKNELKLIGNYFDVSKLDAQEQKHHIRFTSILNDRFDYHNKTLK